MYPLEQSTSTHRHCANQVILDTGSPDLWIVTDSALSGSTNTSVAAQLNYGTDSTDSSSIMGSIFLADVDFGGFSISNQAYSKPTRGRRMRIHANLLTVDVPNNTVSSGLLAPGMGGLIGLSPSVLLTCSQARPSSL